MALKRACRFSSFFVSFKKKLFILYKRRCCNLSALAFSFTSPSPPPPPPPPLPAFSFSFSFSSPASPPSSPSASPPSFPFPFPLPLPPATTSATTSAPRRNALCAAEVCGDLQDEAVARSLPDLASPYSSDQQALQLAGRAPVAVLAS